jgi:anthranilate synthase component 1
LGINYESDNRTEIEACPFSRGDAGGLVTGRGPAGELFNLSCEEFTRLAGDRKDPLIIPVCLEIDAFPVSIPSLFRHLRHGNSFLLESLGGGEGSRYSAIGINPVLRISFGSTTEISGDPAFIAVTGLLAGETALEQLRDLLSKFGLEKHNAPRYCGGVAGYIAYDLLPYLHPGLPRPAAESGPLAEFLMPGEGIVVDHRTGRFTLYSIVLITAGSDPVGEYGRSVERIRAMREKCLAAAPDATLPDPLPAPSVTDRKTMASGQFEEMVRKAKEHIVAGDIFQCVLSREIRYSFSGDPFRVYQALREINPGPYMYFLDFGDRSIVGASPEMLVRVEKGQVTTVPIAGTRPRGRDAVEDGLLAADLLADEKERAEHVMLVDLARNDIGRVSGFGTVRVGPFMKVERFSHVQHIISVVTGTLRGELDAIDVLRACFPAGTVSGAPKLRAMQLIAEIEPDSRGIYAGAVGFFGLDNTLDAAIAIRTIIAGRDFVSTRVGAGIVADSVPEREWEETERKAMAMEQAIKAATRGGKG